MLYYGVCLQTSKNHKTSKMIKCLSSLFLGLFVLSAHAVELPYKSLKKSYETDYEKTLEKAERWMKLLPNNPAPYYYASLIHFEKAQKQTTVRKKYLRLIKSLRYAQELENRNDDDFLTTVAWDTITPFIAMFTEKVNDSLKAQELYRLSAILEKKVRRFDWLNESTDRNIVASIAPESTPELLHTSGEYNGQFFGMPNGSEDVVSNDLKAEQEMLAHINEERIKQGMEPFEWDEDLARAARYHAFDMGTQNYFDHNSFDRTNGKLKEVGGTFQRIRTFYTSSFANSENIAAGNKGAYDTYMQWFNSKGHYENMFNKSSRRIGVGVCFVPGSTYGYYWVMCTAL